MTENPEDLLRLVPWRYKAKTADMAEEKKQVPLCISARLYAQLAAWAEDDFRSING